jgi:hypothetical protein
MAATPQGWRSRFSSWRCACCQVARLDATVLPVKKESFAIAAFTHTHTHTRENSRFVCPTHLLYPETIVIERLTEPGSPQVGEHGSQLLVKRIVEIEKQVTPNDDRYISLEQLFDLCVCRHDCKI